MKSGAPKIVSKQTSANSSVHTDSAFIGYRRPSIAMQQPDQHKPVQPHWTSSVPWNLSAIPISAQGIAENSARLAVPCPDPLARAVSDLGEPLDASIRVWFGQTSDVSCGTQSTDPGCSERAGSWRMSAIDSPAERAARETADRAVGGRNAEVPLLAPELFADTRVHRDEAAALAAEQLSAKAFTLGNQIFFADGQYDPGSPAGRRLIAHELTHVQQAQDASFPTSSVIMRETWTESASKWYGEKKWDIYRAMIAALKKAKNSSVQFARGRVAGLPILMQVAIGEFIDQYDLATDLVIELLLAIIGLTVGFVEGIVGLVTGLINLCARLVVLFMDMITAMLGNPEHYEEDINSIIAAVKNFVPGLREVIKDWLGRYQKAPPEEQVIMGGELVGQIEALIATLPTVEAKAGQAASIGGGAIVRAVGGGTAALETVPALAVVPVAAQVTAQGAVLSQQAMMMSGQGPGGKSSSNPPRPLFPEEKDTLDRLKHKYPERDFKPSAHQGEEFVDKAGKTYDQMGDPQTSKFWGEQGRKQFANSIKEHLSASVDFTVIDLTGFSQEAIMDITKMIEALSQAEQAKIIRIGF
jgi:hypothetical protein